MCVDDAWVLGERAPYGGVVLERSSPASAQALVGEIVSSATAAGARRVIVRAEPAINGRDATLVEWALLDHGFQIVTSHLNHHVVLEPRLADPDTYLAELPRKSRNMLRRGRELGLVVKVARGDDDWRRGHDVVASNKAARGRMMRVDVEGYLAVRDAFPDDVELIMLNDDGGAVAAAITYRTAPGVVLLVAWGDANHDLPRSPMPVLAEVLTARHARAGSRILDLGITSDERGRPNLGLAHFKESVLGVVGHRLDVVLELDDEAAS